MSVKNRLTKLEERVKATADPVRIVVYWPNDDGTSTNTVTGEVVTLGADAVRLRWPEEMGAESDHAATPA